MTLAIALGPTIVLIGWPSSLSFWWLIPAWCLQVVGLTGLSNGAHEAVHGHLFYQPRADRLAGRILHGLLLLNFDIHRQYHLTHHANTGNEDDSEGVFDFNALDSRATYAIKIARWAVPPSPLHILNWSQGLASIRGKPSPFLGKVTRTRTLVGFAVPFTVAAAIVVWLAMNPVKAILGAIVPLFIIAPIFGYMTALPEHFGLAESEFQFRTRNILTIRVLQYLLWNFNLHAVHHKSPHLHFSLLPAGVPEVTAPTANGYLRFHMDVIRQLTDTSTAVPEALGVRT